MISQEKPRFRSVPPHLQESEKAETCWKKWQEPETGRKENDSAQDFLMRTSRNGLTDWIYRMRNLWERFGKLSVVNEFNSKYNDFRQRGRQGFFAFLS